MDIKNISNFLGLTQDRIGRRRFLIAFFAAQWGLPLVAALLTGLFYLVFGEDSPILFLPAIVFFASLIFGFIVYIKICIRRVRDIGITQGWWVLAIIPLINIPFFVYLCVKNGKGGPGKKSEKINSLVEQFRSFFTNKHLRVFLIIGFIVFGIGAITLFFVFSNKPTKVVWEQSNTGLTTLSVNTVTADTNNQSILYAGTDTGIFKSIDKGASWTAINNGLPNPLPEIRKIVHAPYAKAIFALGVGDLFESLDGGNNWVLVGTGMADIALTPYSSGENSYEKIHLVDYGITKDPIIYSISTDIGFFADPQQETRAYINSFFESLFKDQKEINKNNRAETSRLLGKVIEDDDITYDIVRAFKIDFLEKRTLSSGEKSRVIIDENIVSLLSQNTWPTWLQTDRFIYSCWEDFIGCEKNELLESVLKEYGPHPISSGAKVAYSQKGIPHIYANISLSSKLLVKTCLNRGGHWIVENSLEKLEFSPTHIFVYSHNNNDIETYDCFDQEEKEKYNISERLEDVVFTIGRGEDQGGNLLLVSKDNAHTWTEFKIDLPSSVESLFATYNESVGYTIFATTKDRGIFRTSVSFKDLK